MNRQEIINELKLIGIDNPEDFDEDTIWAFGSFYSTGYLRGFDAASRAARVGVEKASHGN